MPDWGLQMEGVALSFADGCCIVCGKSALHGRWTMESGRRMLDVGCEDVCKGGDVGWRTDDGGCRMLDDG